MDSTIQHLKSGETPEQQSLGVLITLIETAYPERDLSDINYLRRMLWEEFNVQFTHEEIENHYLTQCDEEDNRLQYKHLNIRTKC